MQARTTSWGYLRYALSPAFWAWLLGYSPRTVVWAILRLRLTTRHYKSRITPFPESFPGEPPVT